MPASALAPFLLKAGREDLAIPLLQSALAASPASLPLHALLSAARKEGPGTAQSAPPPESPGASSQFVLPAPPPAPGFTLTDESGTIVGMEKWQGQPFLLVFQAGGARTEDAEPLKKLRAHVPSFARFGISIVVVSTEEASLLQEALGLKGTPAQELPFTMLSDRQLTEFKNWGCYDQYLEKPLHGAFLVDGQGAILWSSISHQTCIHPEYLLMECQRLLALWKPDSPPEPATDPLPAAPTGAGNASK